MVARIPIRRVISEEQALETIRCFLGEAFNKFADKFLSYPLPPILNE